MNAEYPVRLIDQKLLFQKYLKKDSVHLLSYDSPSTGSVFSGLTSIKVSRPYPEQINSIQKLFPKLKKLVIRDSIEEEDLEKIITRLEGMKGLQEIEFVDLEDVVLVAKLIPRLPQLKTFSTESSFDEDLFLVYPFLNKVERVNLSVYKDMGEDDEKSWKKRIELLGEISTLNGLTIYSRGGTVKTQTIDRVLDLPKPLKQLVLTSFDFEDQESAIAAINKLKTLERLAFWGTSIRKEAMRKLETNISALEYQYKNTMDNKKEFGIDFGLNRNLKRLSIELRDVSEEVIDGLRSGSVQITELKIARSGISDEQISVFVPFQTSIISLNLNYSNRLSDRSVMVISRHLPQLKQLRLNACNLSNNSLPYIRKMKELTNLSINYNSLGCQEYLKLFFNLRKLFFCQYSGSEGQLVVDEENKGRMLRNVKVATQVWMYEENDSEEYG